MRRTSLLVAAVALVASGSVSASADTPGWEVVPTPAGQAVLDATAFVSGTDGWVVGVAPSSSGVDSDAITEHWDGTAWRPVHGVAVPQSDEAFTGVSFAAADDGWAVGWQDPFGTVRVHGLLAHWDGTQWRPTAQPQGAGIPRGVDARTGSDVWAVGNDLFEHFDGTSWSVAAAPLATAHPAAVTVLAAGNAWAVGGQQDTRPGYHHDVPYLAHWNGHRWSTVAAPDPLLVGSLTAVSAVNANDIWAVGTVEDTRDQQPYVIHFDGTRWSRVAAPAVTPFSGFAGVVAVSSTDVWAVGNHEGHLPNGFAVERTLTEHWDGTSWTTVSSPNDSNHDNYLLAAAAAGGQVWAVGTDGGPLVERTAG